ncbi:polyadenylate-binding protein 3-like [Camellia sinensis]|uniref:polyadenylate-binding protein 3-like n=1 Tax=Camellia sinensis TaxID=4442 RepID=UPI001035567B|nr:polyadenylate-binding protein 3-like [Camellia sinensis]
MQGQAGRAAGERFEGGWQPMFYRGRAAGPRRSGPGLKLFSIFVDNLPYDMDPKGMFIMFSKFGVVKHAYISFKRNKVGTRFGFVRYECVVAAKMAIQKANGVWCGKKQLKVKFADYDNEKTYQRSVSGEAHEKRLRMEGVVGDGGKPNASNVPVRKGIAVSTCRGTKSYADIVKEGGVRRISC